MIFDLLAPSQGVGENICASARPVHVSNSHTKFGWISSNGFGGDSVTDGGDCNIPLIILKNHGDNNSVPTKILNWGFLYPLCMKFEGMK